MPEIESLQMGLVARVRTAHERVADDQRKCRSGCAGGFGNVVRNAIAPEDFPYRHTIEGPDDMPAHVKAALLGSSVSVPVQNGETMPGDVAGNLSVRASQSRRAAAISFDAARRDRD